MFSWVRFSMAPLKESGSYKWSRARESFVDQILELTTEIWANMLEMQPRSIWRVDQGCKHCQFWWLGQSGCGLWAIQHDVSFLRVLCCSFSVLGTWFSVDRLPRLSSYSLTFPFICMNSFTNLVVCEVPLAPFMCIYVLILKFFLQNMGGFSWVDDILFCFFGCFLVFFQWSFLVLQILMVQ